MLNNNIINKFNYIIKLIIHNYILNSLIILLFNIYLKLNITKKNKNKLFKNGKLRKDI